jgi:TRAP-type C4-dicarboxylate transport system permease large subunit
MPMAEVFKAAFDGLALAAPLIIVGSILTGFATAVGGRRGRVRLHADPGRLLPQADFARFMEALTDNVLLSAAVMMIIGVSTVMSWLIAIDQVPQVLARAVLLAENKWVFLGLVVVFLPGHRHGARADSGDGDPDRSCCPDRPFPDRPRALRLITVYGLLLASSPPPVGVALFIVTKVSGFPSNGYASP